MADPPDTTVSAHRPSTASSTRSSTATSSATRTGSSRASQNPTQQLSTIEKSVTHLLVATKQLLETLTLWSRGSATESEVSDVYVRLGYEFNIACRAFNAIGVETTDLGPVPDMLRAILEDTLSQEASQGGLDRYLPRIRDIIINLLHGLKKKQQRLRQRQGAEGTTAATGTANGGPRPPRQASTASMASMGSAESSLTQQLDDIPSRQGSGNGSRSFAQPRQGSGELGNGNDPHLPPRTSSVTTGRASPRRHHHVSPQNSVHHPTAPASTTSDSSSSLSSTTMQNIPVIAPYPEDDTMPANTNQTNQTYLQYQPHQDQGQHSPEPPRPPPKQNDALTALQRGGDLERRASRRFSAYQIQKHLGGTTINGIGSIPPAQNSPVPNRGRDVRESMSAVRSRGVVQPGRSRRGSPRPAEREREVSRISEGEESHAENAGGLEVVTSNGGPGTELYSPMVKTPEDKLGYFPRADETPSSAAHEGERASATLNGPLEAPAAAHDEQPHTPMAEMGLPTPPARSNSRREVPQHRTPPQSTYLPAGVDTSPQPNQPLTLFLQHKHHIKKFVLPLGSTELTLPRLQLAFIEKFAWGTGDTHGVELPDIYIQDPISGVRYELIAEDLEAVRERSVLVLNVEALDEVKRHFDEGMRGLRGVVEGVGKEVEGQKRVLEGVRERTEGVVRDVAVLKEVRISAPPSRAASMRMSSASSNAPSSSTSSGPADTQLKEIQSLRRDLAVVRQTYTTFVSEMQTSMSTLRSAANSLAKKPVPAATTKPAPLDPSSGRAHITTGKTHLTTTSEPLISLVDDLQDLVEDLRKDVVTRGVRPLPRQLESVSKDISTATAQLSKLTTYIKKAKPEWTKIWEGELQVVCDERELLTMQEELAADLEDDLEKVAGIFGLVEEATRAQNLNAPIADPSKQPFGQASLNNSRSTSRTLPLSLGANADPQKAKDGVLGEVRALQPNHESRLEAIERAERARLRELESREGGEFQRELGDFVGEGRLKKSGGVEEVERVRLVREERARRENAENLRERERVRAEKLAAREAGGGEVSAAGGEGGGEGGGGAGGLVVPEAESVRESSRSNSPEAVFVEAEEEVGTPSTYASAGS